MVQWCTGVVVHTNNGTYRHIERERLRERGREFERLRERKRKKTKCK